MSVADEAKPVSASELVKVTGTPTRTVPAASLTVNARVTAPAAAPVAPVEIADSVVATVRVGELVTVIV